MRRYTDSDERRVRTQAEVREWTRAGLIDTSQAAKLNAELAVELVRTNVFLRATVAVFTAVIVFAAVGFIMSALGLNNERPIAMVAGAAALACIALAEVLVGVFRLYRFGVEEMLAASGVVLASVSVALFWSTWRPGSSQSVVVVGLVVATAGGFAIHRRFGFIWAALGAMICGAAIPFQVRELSANSQRMIAAAVLALVLVFVRGKRLRHGDEWPGDEYGTLRAAAFAGIYLVLNLRLIEVIKIFSRVHAHDWFYWGTWMLTWVLPITGLVLSIRDKDRPLLVVSVVMTVLSLVTNKPYLEWPRHTWDPMLLGVLLIGIALAMRRWLSSGPDGVRHGFTAAQILRKDDPLLTVLSAAPISVTPHAHAPAPAPSGFDGGRSGGAGGGGSF